ncbi:hypothetical protein LTR85_003484 [Meristemomyces frigidus]|nr:hypothetical protein LTR85_003484 [Meristemomyces frigidus]
MPRNTSPNQKRNLKPTVSTTSAYSASPSQLTLSSDVSTVGGFHNPYQTYNTYASSPHNPAAFGFPQQHPQYTHQLQTQHQTLPQQHQQQSPTHTRKRRASELGSEGLPGSSSSNASNAFGQPSGLLTGSVAGDLGLSGGLGGPSQPGEQMTSPVAKKGRTNTPWTPAEEQRLKTLRDAGSSWSEIAKTFPARTEGSVKKHWYKDMHYAEFAEDEVSNFSAALLQAIKDYENNKWKVIGQKVGKPAKEPRRFVFDFERTRSSSFSLA